MLFIPNTKLLGRQKSHIKYEAFLHYLFLKQAKVYVSGLI